jgi:mono/diheme cytochrome c family protein
MKSTMSALLTAVTVAIAASGAARADDEAAVKAGNAVFLKWCAACHASGPGHPGTTALQALYKGAKPAALEERTDLTPEFIKNFVRHGVSVMAPFRKTEVSDAELAALSAYLTRTKR